MMAEDNNAALQQFTHLRSQAQEHEKAGRFDEAVQDLRRALALVPRSATALRATTTGEVTSLLVRMQGVRSAEGAVDSLVATCCDAALLLPARVAAAQRLASLSAANPALCVRMRDADTAALAACLEDAAAGEVGEHVELKGDSKDAKHPVASKGDSKEPKDLAAAVLATLSAMADSPAAPTLAALVPKETVVRIIFGTDPKLALKAVAFLSALCSASAESIDTADEWAALFVDTINTCLDPHQSNDLRNAAIHALIKATNSTPLALRVLRHPQLIARVLETASDTDSNALRSVCPIAISRILEPISSARNQPDAPEAKRIIQDQIMGYLESTTSKHKTMGLMALTAVFAASSDYASPILLGDGVIQEILDMIEFEVADVQLATVQMLSSACADQACRKIIGSQDSTRILIKLWKMSTSSEKLKSAAAGTLVKVMLVDKELEKTLFADTRLADGFIAALKANKVEPDVVAASVESLAYLTVRGLIKEIVINDTVLLKALISFLGSMDDKAIQYGIVSVFSNLTHQRKRLGEEEEQLMKLKEVAGENVVKPDPLDDDKRVEMRCIKLMAAGITSPLGAISAGATVSLASAISQLYLNLCVDKRNRGRIVQDGGVKALTSLTTKLSDPQQNPTYLIAAQSLAKIAITTDPTLAFQPVSRALDLIRPLIHLLTNDSSTLQQFEGLMALTNLASFDPDVRTRIVQAKGVKAMEYLQFSENVMVRRAATEALCNMMFDETVFEAYATSRAGEGGGATGGLKMMIMLCDVEDYETRRAASGALAILSSHPDACRLIVGDARGVDTIVGLLFGEEEDANPELVHRAVEVCKNVAAVGGVLGMLVPDSATGKLLHIESRPSEKGRAALVQEGNTDHPLMAGYSLTTSVHEYGGAPAAALDGFLVFTDAKDKRIFVLENDSIRALTTENALTRYADFSIHPSLQFVVCIQESHLADGSVLNKLVSVPLNSTTQVEPTVIASGNDFYTAPRFSPLGTELAWIEWSLPSMPWTKSSLHLAKFNAKAGTLASTHTTVASGDFSVSQPRWSPKTHELYFTTDKTGYSNLYRYNLSTNTTTPLLQTPHIGDFSSPDWVLGQRTYDFLPNGTLVAGYSNQDGTSSIGHIDPTTQTLTPLVSDQIVRTLCTLGSRVFIVSGTPVSPTALSELHLPPPFTTCTGITELRATSTRLPTEWISIPEPLQFPTTNNLPAFGFFYPPKNPTHSGPPGTLPPLIVTAHGGPTAASDCIFSPRIQFWTSRGFAIFDINYGGSTGYGREYRERLDGQWGIVDVDDVCNGALWLAEQGRVDRGKLCVTGGSAGGFTTLAALAFRPSVFSVGTSKYGICDLKSLSELTHKFESKYLDIVLGTTHLPDSEVQEIYRTRSPINHADSITSPLLVLQGSIDRVVPVDQAEKIVAAIRARGGVVGYELFDGEGHGWKQGQNIKKAVELELDFYLTSLRIPEVSSTGTE
ncbi:Dipeptidyl aminopeptidase [Podochytrium sp. JEL0797]|nr:Dipeptidyl aminopeptidase [Podochytrium sp. JEL0797]